MKKLARRDLIINAALGAVAMKTKAEEPPKPVLPTDAEIVATDKTLAHNYTEAERKLWWHLRHRIDVANSHFRRQGVPN